MCMSRHLVSSLSPPSKLRGLPCGFKQIQFPDHTRLICLLAVSPIHLKPNSVVEFTRLIETDTLPLLRKQKGFRDEMTFVVPGGSEAVGISLWDQKENADAYNRDAYPGILKTLGKVVEGTPHV